jgi:hypothetical protein
MVAVRGRIHREGEVVHLFAHHLADLSRELVQRRRAGGRVPTAARAVMGSTTGAPTSILASGRSQGQRRAISTFLRPPPARSR